MDTQHSYWHVQKASEPLYPDLIWSRPENKNQAGKLLIIGGNVHGFSAPAKAYELSTKAGIGNIKVALPDSLAKNLRSSLADAVFCPSTPSGSFAKQSLAELIDLAAWSDLTMLAGDFGRNSETAILLERLLSEYAGPLSITKDALDQFTTSPSKLIERPNTLIVGTVAQLQKMVMKASPENLIKFDMDLIKFVETFRDLTNKYPVAFLTVHKEDVLVSYEGQVSSTKLSGPIDHWRIEAASFASVWWLQNTNKVFDSITTAAYDLNNQRLR